MSRWLSNLIQVIITLVWAATTSAPLVPGVEYEPNPWIHFIFLMTTGANLVVRKNPNEDGDDANGGGGGSGNILTQFIEFMKLRSGGGPP